MNNIPAPKPDTISVYLADTLDPTGHAVKAWYDRPGLRVTAVDVNTEGALVWVDPIGHIQIGDDVLALLLTGLAARNTDQQTGPDPEDHFEERLADPDGSKADHLADMDEAARDRQWSA